VGSSENDAWACSGRGRAGDAANTAHMPQEVRQTTANFGQERGLTERAVVLDLNRNRTRRHSDSGSSGGRNRLGTARSTGRCRSRSRSRVLARLQRSNQRRNRLDNCTRHNNRAADQPQRKSKGRAKQREGERCVLVLQKRLCAGRMFSRCGR
jgi:hypothetical protein